MGGFAEIITLSHSVWCLNGQMINYHIQCGVYGPRSTVFVDKQALNYCSARGHELPIIDHHTMNDDDDYF